VNLIAFAAPILAFLVGAGSGYALGSSPRDPVQDCGCGHHKALHSADGCHSWRWITTFRSFSNTTEQREQCQCQGYVPLRGGA